MLKESLLNKNQRLGYSLVVQWLGLHASTAGGHRFHPWSENDDPANRETQPKTKQNKTKKAETKINKKGIWKKEDN